MNDSAFHAFLEALTAHFDKHAFQILAITQLILAEKSARTFNSFSPQSCKDSTNFCQYTDTDKETAQNLRVAFVLMAILTVLLVVAGKCLSKIIKHETKYFPFLYRTCRVQGEPRIIANR